MSRAGEIQVHCEVIQHAEDSSAKVLNVRVCCASQEAKNI